ncbi:MAG: RodZ domain-containing protein [Thermoleophilia bacterium]
MFEIGDTLREGRLRQGLTIKDVEDSLKIRGKYLQALEQDDFEVLPGSTFVKAFLRSYATFLGLEADVLVAEYLNAHDSVADVHRVRHPNGPSGLSRSARPRTRGRRSQPNYVVVAVVALIVLTVFAIIFRDRGEEPAVIDPENITTTTTAPTDSSDGSGAVGPDGQAGPVGIAVAEAASKETTGEAAAETTGETTGEAAAETTAGDPHPDTLDLVLEVTQNRCWIVVREDSSTGNTLYSGTLEEGQRLSYSVEGRLWLRIGDPSAVRLVADGKPLEVPEPYGDFVVSDTGLRRAE